MPPASMPRTALAVAALSAAGFVLWGCTFLDLERGGAYYRRAPPGYYGGGYHRGGTYRRW